MDPHASDVGVAVVTPPRRRGLPTLTAPHSPLGSWLAYAYLLRVPILITLILIGFPILALRTELAKAIFQNFFVLEWTATFLVTLATFMVTWSVVLNSLVILFNGSDRFWVRPTLTQETLSYHRRRTRWTIAGTSVAIATPMLAGQFLERDWPTPWGNLTAVAAGAAIAYLLAYLALLLVLLMVPMAIAVASDIFPAPAFLRRGLTAAHTWSSRYHDNCWAQVRRLFLALPPDIIVGLIDNREVKASGDKNLSRGLPWSGVVLAFAFAMVTMIVYYAIGISNARNPGGTSVPALCFVLLLLLNASWILTFTAYFWDRFRIPLLALLLVAAVIGEWTDYGEHFYKIDPMQQAMVGISPAAVLKQRVIDDKPIIVVATMGGGIQAAAWTIQVLTGLQMELQKNGHSVADSIALVSAVSGGAHGSLFFMNEYRESRDGLRRPGFAPTTAACGQTGDGGECLDFSPLRKEIVKPRLDDVAWALTYRDIPRIVFPYFPSVYGLIAPMNTREGRFLDRGRMLELSWQKSGITGRLSDWQAGLTEGWRPATIFNATIAETGEPFLFATTDQRPADARDPCGSEDVGTSDVKSWRSPQPMTFRGLYCADIDLVTAARVASGFPYVLPIPRALTEAGLTSPSEGDHRFKYHLMDGGYYDNYGVDSVVQWLDQALSGLKQQEALRKSLKVLIIQIRSFPDIRLPDVNNPPKDPASDPTYSAAVPRNRGWFFELYSPIAGLLRVRSSGQLLHNRNQLRLLRDKWRAGDVDIRFATFEFGMNSVPLSFKMNELQKRHIDEEWSHGYAGNAASRPDDLEQVKCMFENLGSVCEKVRLKDPW